MSDEVLECIGCRALTHSLFRFHSGEIVPVCKECFEDGSFLQKVADAWNEKGPPFWEVATDEAGEQFLTHRREVHP